MSKNIGISDDRYLYCETLTGEWWYKDMKTGEDLPLYSTPIRGREEVEIFSRWQDPVIEEKDKEIVRLNNIIKVKDEGFKASTEDLCETTEKLEKANNIINKMNDYLVMNIANGSLDFMYRQGFKDCYEKLIELKGDDK